MTPRNGCICGPCGCRRVHKEKEDAIYEGPNGKVHVELAGIWLADRKRVCSMEGVTCVPAPRNVLGQNSADQGTTAYSQSQRTRE